MFTQIEPARLRRSQKQRDVCSAYSMGIKQSRLWKAIASFLAHEVERRFGDGHIQVRGGWHHSITERKDRSGDL